MAKAPFKLKSGNITPFKQMGSSPVKQIPGDKDDKKVFQTGPGFGGRTFTKGARTKGGDVTVERGKKTTYTRNRSPMAGDVVGGYTKKVEKKKKGSKPGASTWETTKTKRISSKRAQRQIKRKLKRHTKIDQPAYHRDDYRYKE